VCDGRGDFDGEEGCEADQKAEYTLHPFFSGSQKVKQHDVR